MKRLPRLALPLAAALLLSACGTSPEEHFDLAKAAFAKSDYQTAKTELGQALKADPRNRDMVLLLARTQLLLGDGEGALGAVERLRAAGMKGVELTRMEAEAALLRGKGAEAVRLLEGDGNADAWRIRAAAQVLAKDNDAAMAAFRSGLAAGGNYRLSLDFAKFLVSQGDLPGASAQFAVLRKARADGIETLMFGGALSEKYERRDLADKYYLRAARLYPFRVEPLVALGNLLDLQGKVDEAGKMADAAAKLNPGDPQVSQLQISVYSEQGKWQKVRDLLQAREGELDPTTADGLKYAEALLRLGRVEQARAMFLQSLQAQPQNRYVRIMLAEAQLATGDPKSALDTMRPAMLGPFAGRRELEMAKQAAEAAKSPEAGAIADRLASPEFAEQQRLSGQAQGAEIRGQSADALRLYQQLAGYGMDGELARRIALAATNVGQYDLAIATADKALATEPDNAELLYVAALARVKAGRDQARAAVLIERALSFDSRNVAYRALQEKAKAAAG